MKTRHISWLWLALPVVISLLAFRQPTPQQVMEAEPVLAAAAQAAIVPSLAKLPPASLPEARAAIKRVFAGAVHLDTAHLFITADLNCDGSEDLAAVVGAVPSRLADLNSELANWIVQDAASAAVSTRVKVQAGEKLLVIIHGYGEKGWRTSEAQQAYVLLNAVSQEMQPAPAAGLLTVMHTRPPTAAVRCEALKEAVDGAPGYLFWDGGRYMLRAEAVLARMHSQTGPFSPHTMH